jgi:hypothetical protein
MLLIKVIFYLSCLVYLFSGVFGRVLGGKRNCKSDYNDFYDITMCTLEEIGSKRIKKDETPQDKYLFHVILKQYIYFKNIERYAKRDILEAAIKMYADEIYEYRDFKDVKSWINKKFKGYEGYMIRLYKLYYGIRKKDRWNTYGEDGLEVIKIETKFDCGYFTEHGNDQDEVIRLMESIIKQSLYEGYTIERFPFTYIMKDYKKLSYVSNIYGQNELNSGKKMIADWSFKGRSKDDIIDDVKSHCDENDINEICDMMLQLVDRLYDIHLDNDPKFKKYEFKFLSSVYKCL